MRGSPHLHRSASPQGLGLAQLCVQSHLVPAQLDATRTGPWDGSQLLALPGLGHCTFASRGSGPRGSPVLGAGPAASMRLCVTFVAESEFPAIRAALAGEEPGQGASPMAASSSNGQLPAQVAAGLWFQLVSTCL